MLYCLLAYLLVGFVTASVFIMFDNKNVSPHDEINIYDILLYIECLFLWPLFVVGGLLIYWIKFLRRL